MSIEIAPHVESLTQQNADIQASTSLGTYQTYVQRHFEPDPESDQHKKVQWLPRLERELASTILTVTPEYFQFLTTITAQAASYGFPYLKGIVERHNQKHFQRSIIDPFQLAALASYLGFINTQAYPLKQNLFDKVQLQGGMPEGVWGLQLPVMKGQISDLSNNPSLQSIAADRHNTWRPILVPNVKLNADFAALGLMGEEACTIKPVDFQKKYFPLIHDIVSDYFDPIPVFFQQPKGYVPAVFYSHP